MLALFSYHIVFLTAWSLLSLSNLVDVVTSISCYKHKYSLSYTRPDVSGLAITVILARSFV